ncbi:MAG: LarC family nickel insertion protein, partial [Oscillospiraceae bacterium]|nr:LarC family nickel insertion protein [Oscillospiraceae bacterium]
MDAVADISAVCFMLDALGVDRVTASPLCTGFGQVRCAHGLLPVPAPATALILEGMPCFAGDTEGEQLTPTGAALVKFFAQSYGRAPEMELSAVGYGMGSRDTGRLNAVRMLLGESAETAVELMCNVDDMSPEAVGFAIDRLLENGALDAYAIPIGMKKNRPGLMLSCICTEAMRDKLTELMFRHTSTIGIRETLCRRYVLRRGTETVETPYGSVRIKRSEGYGLERVKAEFDDLAAIARAQDMSLEEVRRQVLEKWS